MTTTRQIMRRHNTGLVCRRIYIFSTCLVFLLGLLSVVFITVPLVVERPLCNDILFNNGSPAVIILPPFNASHVRIELPDPNYFLDYQEGVDDNGNLSFTICVNNSIKLDLVCMSFDARKTAICQPSDYPQCLPAAFDSGRQGSNPAFGVSIINVESNVTVYHIKAIYPSEAYSETLTWQDSNDLNSVWLAGLNCSILWLLIPGMLLGEFAVMLCLVLCLLLPFCALHFLRTKRRTGPGYQQLLDDPEEPSIQPDYSSFESMLSDNIKQTYRPTSHSGTTIARRPYEISSPSLRNPLAGPLTSLSQTYRPTSHRPSGCGSLPNPLAGPLTLFIEDYASHSQPDYSSSQSIMSRSEGESRHSMVESSAAQEQPQQPRSDTMSLEQTRPLEPDTLHPPRLTPALIPSAAASLEDSGKPIRSIQEVQLDNLCWIPFGMDSFKLFKSDRKEGSFSFIPVRNLTSHLYTSSKDKEEILLEWSEEHLTPNALTTVTYAVIADGPFDLPPGFPKRCSMVVYVVTEGDGLKEPLCLHLPHWSKFEDSSSLTCLRAPHTLAPGHTHYSFKELDKESYKIHPNKCIVKVDGRNCLFAIAGQQGVLDDYQYQVLERKLSICEKELRIFITFGTGTWRKIVCNFCKGSEETEWDTSYEIPWTIDRDSDVLRSTLRPASQGQGWTVSVSGLNALRVERLDFRNKSSIRHADSLKEAVEERYYPHAFRYRVVQNEVPPGANTRIVATNIVLEPTHPGPVTIPLSMVEHDSGQARPKVDFKPPVALQRSTPDKPGPSPPTPLVPPPLDYPSLHTYIEPLITHEWERFAINLGVTVAMKERIRKDCFGRCEVACKEVLIRWLAGVEGTGRDPRTWSTVLKAVREAGFPDVADELQKRLSLVDKDDQK